MHYLQQSYRNYNEYACNSMKHFTADRKIARAIIKRANSMMQNQSKQIGEMKQPLTMANELG